MLLLNLKIHFNRHENWIYTWFNDIYIRQSIIKLDNFWMHKITFAKSNCTDALSLKNCSETTRKPEIFVQPSLRHHVCKFTDRWFRVIVNKLETIKSNTCPSDTHGKLIAVAYTLRTY